MKGGFNASNQEQKSTFISLHSQFYLMIKAGVRQNGPILMMDCLTLSQKKPTINDPEREDN